MFTISSFTRKFAKPLWKWYLAGIIALALTNLITLEIPQLAKTIVNAIESPEDPEGLRQIALLIIALGVLTIVIRTLSRIFIFWPGRKLEADSKSYLFSKMMSLPQSFYDRFGMGELISRLANDIGQIRAFYAFGVLQFLNLAFLLIFTISKMMSIHSTLTVACLSPILIMVVMMRYMMTYMHRISLENQQAVGRLTNRVTEAFVNVHVIKANAAARTFLDRSAKENEDVYQTNLKQVFLRTVLFPLMGTLMNIAQVIVIFYGGYEVLEGRVTVGDLLAFNVYIAYLGFPLSAFGIFLSLYQRVKTALSRISDIEEATPQKPLPAQVTTTKPKASPLLEVKHLSYEYPRSSEKDTKPFALKDISLTLEPGKHIGIFGAIGSGKSTLFDLMTRMIEPPQGTIFLNGEDVLTLDPKYLRQHIGYAQQTVHLFSNSIRDNLCFGVNGPIDDDRLKSAADHAQIKDEIEHFSQGWETQIGEKGLRLSGGQKQRLALARIFLRSPDVLLLDDVLSAVDQSTETRLLNYINRTDAAMLLASHRVSALKQCDEVILLDHGVVLDRGHFKDLLARHPDLLDEIALPTKPQQEEPKLSV